MIEILVKNIKYVYVLLCLSVSNIYAQESINVIQSNQLNQLIKNDTLFHKFSGNVIIEYSDLKIKCDTILIDQEKNIMLGWGNTTIYNDTLNCRSDSIKINQYHKALYLYQNSIITINKMKVSSNYIEYNYKNNTLQYFHRGIVEKKPYHINSDRFTYDVNTSFSQFYENIQLVTNDYVINTKKMDYLDNIIEFSGYTEIEHTEFNITCNNGSFKKDNFLKLSNHVVLNLEKEIIKSDFLEKDLITNTNLFKQNVSITFDENMSAQGNTLIQFNNTSKLTDDCRMLVNNIDDSINIKGDAIIMNNETEKIDIINNVTIQGETINGRCQKLIFKPDHEEITMSIDPILWFNNTQITGTEIMVYLDKNELDSMYIPNKPFIISPHDSLIYYNQIRGLVLEGRFQNNTIDYIQLKGNSQMKYFDISRDSIININNVESGQIHLHFKQNQIQTVSCFDQIEANQVEIENKKETKNIKNLLYFDNFKLIEKPF